MKMCSMWANMKYLPRVHATPEEFENGALFLQLGLPSTLIWRNCPPKTQLFVNALENGKI